MHTFVRQLITEWRRLRLPVEDATVVVGVSGGTDSCSLLLALHDLKQRKKLDLRIVAAHFNHKLRAEESDADEEFVKQLCTKLRVELTVGQAKLAKDGNLEQNARDARYAFFTETARRLDASAVVTGHTMNDQAETLLMNLIRGSGPQGLRGMNATRQLGADSKAMLARPLLSWARRRNTEGFCHDVGVECRYDTMNDDTAFRRVRIRKILLPLLEDMNPNIIETLANTAFLLQAASSPVSVELPKTADTDPQIKDLRQLSQAELYEWIRTWLSKKRGNTRQLQLKHIQSVERLILSRKSGRVAELPGGASVLRSGGRLVYEENQVENRPLDN